MKVMPIVAAHPALQRLSKPTLCHADLHLGNIFVSEQDPTMIVGIIDWQFSLIMPAFTQVQWPTFLNPPENYQEGMVKPELPANFDEMDSDEKAFAISERNQAMLAKCYEAALTRHHLESYLALTRVDPSISHLFSSSEKTYKDGVIPLRDSLVQISENWHQMGLPQSCPYLVTCEDLSKHRQELHRYRDWHKLWGYTQELLHTDKDGWVPPQLDFDKVKAKHDELFQLYIQKEAAETSEDEVKSLWFYVDRD
ncbi:hypothetical protein VTN96DRAFT_5646 [Rasamsonia emersonii]